MNAKIRSALLLAATSLLLLATSAARAQVLACGSVVTQSVSLQADVACSAGQNGLIVGASGITIDLNGYTIRGRWRPGSPSATGIFSSGHDDLTIIGPGRISGFSQPMWIGGSKGLFIGKVDARTPFSQAAYLFGIQFGVIENSDFNRLVLSGDYLNGESYGNQVRGNRFTSVPGAGGGSLRLQGCDVYENVVLGNEVVGDVGQYTPVLALWGGGYGNNFVKNRVYGPIDFNGASNTLRDNTIEVDRSASYAVAILSGNPIVAGYCRHGHDEGRDNVLTGNLIVGGNSGVRLQQFPSALPSMMPARFNRIGENEFKGQSGSGIFFTVQSEKNDGTGNTYSNVPYIVIDHGQGNVWP